MCCLFHASHCANQSCQRWSSSSFVYVVKSQLIMLLLRKGLYRWNLLWNCHYNQQIRGRLNMEKSAWMTWEGFEWVRSNESKAGKIFINFHISFCNWVMNEWRLLVKIVLTCRWQSRFLFFLSCATHCQRFTVQRKAVATQNWETHFYTY